MIQSMKKPTLLIKKEVIIADTVRDSLTSNEYKRSVNLNISP